MFIKSAASDTVLQLQTVCVSCAAYNASGGGGIADSQDLGGGRLHVKFDPETLYIPDVNYKTAKFLGAPMVPPFRIQIKPVKLEVLLCFPAEKGSRPLALLLFMQLTCAGRD